MRHRSALGVMLHPNSGCEAHDHHDWPAWLGAPSPLDLSCLHCDCPGCTADDCVGDGREAVLSGTAEECGLVTVDEVAEPYLALVDAEAFYAPGCVSWVRETLPAWESDCPANCDFFIDKPNATECVAHANTLPLMRYWADSICGGLSDDEATPGGVVGVGSAAGAGGQQRTLNASGSCRGWSIEENDLRNCEKKLRWHLIGDNDSELAKPRLHLQSLTPRHVTRCALCVSSATCTLCPQRLECFVKCLFKRLTRCSI